MILKNNNVRSKRVAKWLLETDSGFNAHWFTYHFDRKVAARERQKISEIQPGREELQTSFFYLLERIVRSLRWYTGNRKYQHHNNIDFELLSPQLQFKQWWRVYLGATVPGYIPKHCHANNVGDWYKDLDWNEMES